MAYSEDMIIEKWAFRNGLLIYPVRVNKKEYELEIQWKDNPPKRGTLRYSVKETKWADKIRELRRNYFEKVASEEEKQSLKLRNG